MNLRYESAYRRRSLRGRGLWLPPLLVLALAFPSPFGRTEGIDFGGSIELGGTFDTNPLLTTDDYDFELRRLHPDETEEDDFYGSLIGNLHLTIPVGDAIEKKISYRGEVDRFDDLVGEHRERHNLAFSPTIHLSPDVDLIFEYEFEYDNRRRGAEYLRPDYLEHLGGAMLRWKVSQAGRLTLGYQYENRDYEGFEGTPFDDYWSHVARITYGHRMASRTRGDVELRYMFRDYDDTTRDALGDPISDVDREDERFEIRLTATHLPNSNSLFRLGYMYRNHWASGEFYDYDVHRLSGIWVQKLPWEVRLQAYVHHDWRNYDDQLAQETSNDGQGGDPSQEFTDDVRADRQFFLLLNLTKELGNGLACGTEFQFLSNDSNDDSGEYESQRYSVFVRYNF